MTDKSTVNRSSSQQNQKIFARNMGMTYITMSMNGTLRMKAIIEPCQNYIIKIGRPTKMEDKIFCPKCCKVTLWSQIDDGYCCDSCGETIYV